MSNRPLVHVINNAKNSVLPNSEKVQYISRDIQEIINVIISNNKGTWQWGGFSGGFCVNRLCIGPLHYVSSHSNFSFKFSEIFVIEKRLPDSTSRGDNKIAYRYNFIQTFKYINGDSTLHPWLLFCQIDLFKGLVQPFKVMRNFKNLNSDYPTHHSDSPTQRVGESPTLRVFF